MADESEDERDYILEAITLGRGYASFFEWPPAPKLVELDLGETLVTWLYGEPMAERLSVYEANPPTPDLVLEHSDGRKIGIEVTELVDGEAIAAARKVQKRRAQGSDETVDIWSWWTPARIVAGISKRIAEKDGKLEATRGEFDEVFVVIHTDEPDIDRPKAEEVIRSFHTSAAAIDRAFFVMSYNPSAKRVFPGGYPVFEIPIARTPAERSNREEK